MCYFQSSRTTSKRSSRTRSNSIRSSNGPGTFGSLGSHSFDSADALYKTIYGNVSDEFIGRKYYDDRGGNPAEVPGAPSDEEHVSF